MPEYPDICILSHSMDKALRGLAITEVVVNQPKCLNLPPGEFCRAVAGRAIRQVGQRGKWALAALDGDYTLALNLGMGGEVRLHDSEETPDPKRERVIFRLSDNSQLWAHFWWFGSVHVLQPGGLDAHLQISKRGPDPMAEDFTAERLAEMLRGKRGAIKKYLLDQSFIAGIGNVYIQDILWHARLHPLRAASTMGTADAERLHGAIRHVLGEGIRWGGGPGEQDIWGNKGTYHEHLQVGYQTGKPCPACGALVEELRVGSTTSYICPRCQI